MQLKQLCIASTALFFAVSLSGCAGVAGKKDAQPVSTSAYDPDKPIRMALAKTAEQINLSLRVLAEVKNAELQMTMGHEKMAELEWQSRVVPPNMDVQISLDWAGTPHQPLAMIADYTGYLFKEMGSRPNPMPIINIKSVSRPAIDLIRDIGTQLGEAGSVRVMPATKTIYLDYGVTQ